MSHRLVGDGNLTRSHSQAAPLLKAADSSSCATFPLLYGGCDATRDGPHGRGPRQIISGPVGLLPASVLRPRCHHEV